MPFDNPSETRFGDAELLWDVRERIFLSSHWGKGSFRDQNRYCLVGAISVVAGSPNFHLSNRLERRIERLLVLLCHKS